MMELSKCSKKSLSVLLAIQIAGASAAGAATAGSSSFGTGVYANAGLSYDSTTEFTETNDTVYTGSTVTAGGNINFNAGGNMLQSGSIVASMGGDVAYNIAGDLRFDAVRNSSKFESGSDSKSASIGFGNNAVSASASMSSSSSKSVDYSHTNAATYAEEGTISYNVGGNMTGMGYNAQAKHIKGDIKGDLTLNSLQDTGTSSNKSMSVGISASSGGTTDKGTTTSTAGAGGNFSNSNGSGNYTQTNVSSIIGSESVDLNVGGKLSMTGSTIANVDADGNDKGKLKLSAQSFEWTDLKDSSENNQSGFNIGTNISSSTTSNAAGDVIAKSPIGGSTTIGFTNMGSMSEGMTYATIGNGQVEIRDGSSIEGLNRDVANNQVTTKELVTGALNGSVTVDNRLLTSAGRESIMNDFKNFDENVEQMGKNMRNSIVVKAIENAATDGNKNIFDTTKSANSHAGGRRTTTNLSNAACHMGCGTQYTKCGIHWRKRRAESRKLWRQL